MEEHWTSVDTDTMEREVAMVGGDLGLALVDVDEVRFPEGDVDEVRRWVADVAPTLPTPVHLGISSVEADGHDVVVRFGPRVEPAAQWVAGRQVACHLHGVVGTPSG